MLMESARRADAPDDRGLHVGRRRLPGMDEPASVLHSDAYCMTAASQEKDAAWTFLEFALGPEGQRIAAESGRTVPSLRSVAESDAFLDPEVDPAHSEVFVEQLRTSGRSL